MVSTLEPNGTSVICWLATPVAMFYRNLQNPREDAGGLSREYVLRITRRVVKGD